MATQLSKVHTSCSVKLYVWKAQKYNARFRQFYTHFLFCSRSAGSFGLALSAVVHHFFADHIFAVSRVHLGKNPARIFLGLDRPQRRDVRIVQNAFLL